MKTIESKICKGRQSVTLAEVLDHKGKKFKISIKRDSHDFQSYARIYVWRDADLSWQKVHGVHYSQMQTKNIAYSDCATKADFEADRKALVSMAKKIIVF